MGSIFNTDSNARRFLHSYWILDNDFTIASRCWIVDRIIENDLKGLRIATRIVVNLEVLDNKAVIFPSTRMDTEQKRLKFQKAVNQIRPAGGTNLVAGIKLGYEQVMSNYREEYTNRVLFLTDGMGTSEGILEMAVGRRERR